MKEWFRRRATRTSQLTGSPYAFMIAFGLVVVWLLTGPFFHYSDTWELVINTSTSIITFLMLFVLQSSQNRDSTAIQLKLDELLRAMKEARTSMVSLEDLTEEELEVFKTEFRALQERRKQERVTNN